jgi:hypothetical protein
MKQAIFPHKNYYYYYHRHHRKAKKISTFIFFPLFSVSYTYNLSHLQQVLILSIEACRGERDEDDGKKKWK